ncbi:MAG: hypothetical protein KR126chlam1_00136 [Chlamydiae bacterium]|nr:hypothetical protein [Chlamydiota bacterium]
MTKKVGRNDPCPCGSGKKYKKCCEERLGPKRKFQATILSGGGTPASVEGKASKISVDFFNRAAAPPEEPRKPEEDEPKHPPEADKPM